MLQERCGDWVHIISTMTGQFEWSNASKIPTLNSHPSFLGQYSVGGQQVLWHTVISCPPRSLFT